jgi:hypothetical protein
MESINAMGLDKKIRVAKWTDRCACDLIHSVSPCRRPSQKVNRSILVIPERTLAHRPDALVSKVVLSLAS